MSPMIVLGAALSLLALWPLCMLAPARDKNAS